MTPVHNRFPILLLALLPVCLSAPAAETPRASEISPPPLESGLLDTRPLVSVLPADEAFDLSVLIELPDTVIAMWEVREGYYLYRKSLEFVEEDEPHVLGAPELPSGIAIRDEFFGDVEVYYDRVLVRLPLTDTDPDTINLQIHYQGCAEVGYCYPIQQKAVTLEFLP